MTKYRVFLTGATGAMGFLTLQELLKERDELSIVILSLPTKQDRKKLAPYENMDGLDIHWGDLREYEDVKTCVEGTDLILHVGAFVSPAADYFPKKTMEINFGSMRNIVRAIKECKQEQRTKLVSIGTIAETGDRMPPIHWGRTGDPIKPSIYDYYAISKIVAERHMIESDLPYWVSLRQTGIMGPAMARINDAIMFHNCLDNVLEYVSDRDSAIMLRNLCQKERKQALDDRFWGHIFNIGGGESCRASGYEMFIKTFEKIGFSDLSCVVDSKWFATRNFHGQYYLDSDKLNDILDFRNDSLEYFYECYAKELGMTASFLRFSTSMPGGQSLLGMAVRQKFLSLARTEHGTVRFTENDMEDKIAAFWGTKAAWEALPPIAQWKQDIDWDRVVHIDHGYDEDQPMSELTLSDVKEAATFRGGECLSDDMEKGNWTKKLRFRCGFEHEFEASPRLILKGGHWCPVCERESWNYQQRAKIDPFFAQVWYPLHDEDETPRTYKKIVSDRDV